MYDIEREPMIYLSQDTEMMLEDEILFDCQNSGMSDEETAAELIRWRQVHPIITRD